MGTEIEITAADGQSFAAYLALPKTVPAPGLIVLPEVFNTNDHIRAVADGYAEEGYLVIAPDVYFRQEAGAYMSYTDEGRTKAQSLRSQLDTDQYARVHTDQCQVGIATTAPSCALHRCTTCKHLLLGENKHRVRLPGNPPPHNHPQPHECGR